MPDYIYLLENRLSPSQQSALQLIREAARESGMTVFLTGGAVRDLTSGSPVRDLDVSVQGNALSLKGKLKDAGAVIWGEHAPSQTLYARFPGSVRVEVSSTRREEFPKPGKPVYHPASILEDLRRRDFTANAMALSLNDGSYGLLMDPLNGVADLEARLLRLVSNYGFLEDPIRLVRAVRLQTRLGWELEEKTKTRFDNARQEGMIGQVSAHQLGYEIEEIVHEEDGLKILKALEADGWMKALFPAWTSAKVDVQALESLREVLVQLQMQGVNPDPSAAQAELLTAKLPPKDLAALKKLFVRQGFVHEWETQEERAKEFGKRLTSKEAALPSAAWKLLTSADPEAVLWLALTSKSGPVQAKFKDFFTVWPEARQRIPYTLMQEMRITPELEGYQELLKSIFFELIDGKLTTDEEIRAFLEPHSPPAPPPPVSIRRTRAKRSSEKSRARESEEDEPSETRSAHGDEDGDEELDLDEESDSGDERPELIARTLPPIVPPLPPPPVAAIEETPLPAAMLEEKAAEEVEPAPAPVKSAPKRVEPAGKAEVKAEGKAEVVKPAVKAAAAKTPVKSASKPVPAKTAAKTATKPTGKVPAKAAAKPKPVAKSAPPAKAGMKKAAVKTAKGGKPSAKPKPVKVVAKAKPAVSKSKPAPALKKAAKVVAKTAVKSAPAKAAGVKTAAKKAPVKKRR
jgi:tRNA nucleotidyltransferase/poly(A) polymerase